MKKLATIFTLTDKEDWKESFNFTVRETEEGVALHIQQYCEYQIGVPTMIEYNNWSNN